MRRGELINCTWSDIDLAAQTLTVSPKEDTKETWAWLIKDCDRRTLPLTEEVVQILADHQSRQPERHPYIFVLPTRYTHIQNQLRASGRWRYSDSRQKVIPKFNKACGKILQRAGIEYGTFHDLRRTAISNWLATGLSEFEVMKLAGHSNFSTTHRFYLRVRDDMINRARKAGTRIRIIRARPYNWEEPGVFPYFAPGGCGNSVTAGQIPPLHYERHILWRGYPRENDMAREECSCTRSCSRSYQHCW